MLPGQLLYIALAITLSFILAYLSWHVYEKHFLKLKVLFPSGSAAHQVVQNLGPQSGTGGEGKRSPVPPRFAG
jgi:peptidoglycan/LPS O-acetylase OafA/YrhL